MATLTKPGYITLADLQATGACQSQVDLFRATFGDEVKLNKRNLAKALRTQLDVSWCARFLTAPARAEYARVIAPARAEYDRVRAAALAEYDRVRVAAWAESARVMAPAWAEYERVMAAARAEYERGSAAALLAALTAETSEVKS